MTGIPEAELKQSRAALAPTMEAIAAILPWLSKPHERRFPVELNQRWIAACQQLSNAWSARFDSGIEAVRPAIFALYRVAVETADADCLHLGEALASATDGLEVNDPSLRLTAALAACVESLLDAEGLESPVFAERASHFAQRLDSARISGTAACPRSTTLDRLFVSEANEQLERMQYALALLPPDPFALKLAALELAQAAENSELFDITLQARQLAASMNIRIADLDKESTRSMTLEQLRHLAEAIAAVNR